MNIFLLLILSQTLTDHGLVTVGAPMVPYNLPNQHGEPHKFSAGTRWVVFSFEKKTGAMVNRWLKKEPAGFLAQHRMDFLVEISGMPNIIANKIALPKMRKYKHQVLIADDSSFQKIYLKNAGKVTVFQLNPQGIVEVIHYVADSEALKRLVTDS